MKRIIENIDKVLVGGITVLYLSVISIVMYIYDSNYMVPIWIICIIAMIAYLVCIIIYAFLKNVKDDQDCNSEFKVDYVFESDKKCTLLLRKNRNLKLNNIVSIYFVRKNKVEEFIGLGFVTNIQQDGRIQVKIVINNVNYDTDKLKKVYKDIIIKTILNYDNITELIER